MNRAAWALGMILLTSAAPAAQGPTVFLSVRGNRLFLPVAVDGYRTEAILDSAAESSLIDPSFAHELGVHVSGQAIARGSGGQQDAQFAQASVRVGPVELKDITVGVVDLADVSHRLIGSTVRFVLGRELFDAARLRIDIEGRSLEVLSRSAPVAGVSLPLAEHDGIESMPVRVEGMAAAADVDLGNGNDILIGKAFAVRKGLLTPGAHRRHAKGRRHRRSARTRGVTRGFA